MSNKEEIVMPTFEFEDLSLEQAEELSKVAPKRIAPGLYQYEITEAAFAGPAKKDPTWHMLKLTLSLTDGEVKTTVLIPTKGYLYGEKQTKFPLQSLQKLLSSIGVSDDLTQLKRTLPKLLGKDGSKIVGHKGEVRLDYMDNHLEKQGDRIVLLDRKGNIMKDQDGLDLDFPDFEAGKAYVEANKIQTYGFVKVAEFVPRPAKLTAVVGSDIPF